MVLGAGLFQLPGIKRAMELGYRVITVDCLPDNIGHGYSDEKIICSTVDHEGILKIAKEAKIDGLITFCSDVAAFSVAYASEKLGLKGPDPQATKIMTRKDAFREFQKSAGLNGPDFVAARSFQEIGEFLKIHDRSLVFKPVDNSGSRGITVVSRGAPEEVRRAFDHAFSSSRAGVVCVEESVDGVEVGGDGFILDGKLRYQVITHKYKNGVVTTGHSLPDNLSGLERQSVLAEIEKGCKKLGYNNGPVNFDVAVYPGGATILEFGPRNGGNGIAEIMSYGKDLKILDIGIQFAMGEPLGTEPSGNVCRGCGSFVFGSQQNGILKSIATSEEVLSRVPEAMECVLIKKAGDRIEKFAHGGALIGYAVFKCPVPSDYAKITEKIERALHLEITPGEEP